MLVIKESVFSCTKTAGVSATKLDKLGWRASDTAEIAFDNVEIQWRI
jgi:alkylation response protein AidB-like acyl-CoA dehydrogenase